MFALLVQYNKLVSVLTGTPLLLQVVLQLLHSPAGLGWDLNLKPTPGAWPYGTGASPQSSQMNIFVLQR
jgi:hypothetical protein